MTSIIETVIDCFNLDAGQPEVVQRGSPWYEKRNLLELAQNIFIVRL